MQHDDDLWVPRRLGADVALAVRGWTIPSHARHRTVKRVLTRAVLTTNSALGRSRPAPPSSAPVHPDSAVGSPREESTTLEELELRIDVLERVVARLADERS